MSAGEPFVEGTAAEPKAAKKEPFWKGLFGKRSTEPAEGSSSAPPPQRKDLLDWRYFFLPIVLYNKNKKDDETLRFRRVHEPVPILFMIVSGFQHVSACYFAVVVPAFTLQGALRGIVARPIATAIMMLDPTIDQGLLQQMVEQRSLEMFPRLFGSYTIQSMFIISGLASLLLCLKIKIPSTPYQLGCGLPSFLAGSGYTALMFVRLMARIHQDHSDVEMEEAYGMLLGTSAVCSILLLLLSFIPRRFVKPIFPPLICGIIITLVGIEAVTIGVEFWGGGPDCALRPESLLCKQNGDVILPYGSEVYIGLGFLVLTLFLTFELVGSAFVRHNIVLLAIGIGFILAIFFSHDGDHYVNSDIIDKADPIHFLWTNTYKLGFHKSAIMPFMGLYLVTYLQSTAVFTATAEECKITNEEEVDSSIQGGITVTALMSLFSALATGMPLMPVAQNIAIPSLTRIGSIYAALGGAIWLLVLGIFGHITAVTLQSPASIYGGILGPLSAYIVAIGFKTLSRERWDRRKAIIFLVSMTFGLADLLIPTFIDYQLWQTKTSDADFVESFRFAILTMMRVPYFLGGVVAIILHLLLPKNMDMNTPSDEGYSAVVQ